MKRERLNIVLIGCTGILLGAIYLGAKGFTLNQQAWDMWRDFGYVVLDPLLAGHPHGLRYAVYFPIFAFADLLGTSPDLVFTYVCVAALFAISGLVGRVVSDQWGYAGFLYRRDFVTVAIFALSLLMHGRMILPFLGYLLVIFVGVDWFKRRKWGFDQIVTLALGILLTSLSSGTLLVAMALAAGIVAVTALRDTALFIRTPQLTISVVVILLLFAAPAVIGIAKNLDFYGGGSEAVVRMLDHGAGGEVLDSLGQDIDDQDDTESLADDKSAAETILQFWWVGLLLWAAGAWSLGWRPIPMVVFASPGENMLHLAATLAFVGGLFGYSVLTLAIIPLLILNSGSVATVARSIKTKASGSGVAKRG